MNYTKNVKIIVFLSIFLVVVSIFIIPEIIMIYKNKHKLNNIKILVDKYADKKNKFSRKLQGSKNYSVILKQNKKKENAKIKELIKKNSLYDEGIEEVNTELYIAKKRTEIMIGLLKIYEKNNLSAYNTINKVKNYFINNTLEDYYKNISNILLISSIIENMEDINFIYDKIIQIFFSENENKEKQYILGTPCFKSSIDTNEPQTFHEKCNKFKYTIMLIKTNKTRFGGITDLSWEAKSIYEIANYENTKTRLFNLDNKRIFLYNKNYEFTKHIPPIRGDNYCFAIFGSNDIYLGYLPWDSCSAFPKQFLKSNDTKRDFNDLLNQNYDFFYSNDEVKFEYNEIEVYPIITINKNYSEI